MVDVALIVLIDKKLLFSELVGLKRDGKGVGWFGRPFQPLTLVDPLDQVEFVVSPLSLLA